MILKPTLNIVVSLEKKPAEYKNQTRVLSLHPPNGLRIRWLAILLLTLYANVLPAQQTVVLRGNSDGMAYRVEQLADNLGVVWGMAFVSSHQLLITQRDGRVSLFDTIDGRITAINGAPEVFADGQGGLLDVSVAPGYRPGDWIYFTYSKDFFDAAATTLARARLRGRQLTDWQDLLVTASRSDSTRHFGSRIAFDANHLFITVGDRGHRPNGQNLQTHAGKVLRLHLDGSVPDDNPFVKHNDALPEIWSYGHRNPQGIAYDQQRKVLWLIEHGPRGGDEINLIEAGANYGWPLVSHGREYFSPRRVGEATHMPGMKDPVKVYTPSIAPGSLLLYTGQLLPAWQGNLFAGALKLRHLNRIVLKNNQAVTEERLLSDLDERIRSLAQAPGGALYLGTDSGKLLRIVADKAASD